MGGWCLKINDINVIKQEILNTGMIPKILETLGCEYVNKTGDRFEAQLPDEFNSSNIRSVQVYENENLTSAVRSRGVKGDIYTLVSFLMTGNNDIEYLNKQLYKAKNKILYICGWKKNDFEYQKEKVHNSWLQDMKEKRTLNFDLSSIEPNTTLPESVLDEFIMLPHTNWIKDNIDWHTQKEFEVGFDLETERIVLVIRNKHGNIIGVKGRSTKSQDEKYYKYMPIYRFMKSKELFNLHRSLPYIVDKKEIILWESEKSCLKSHQYGIYNTVSQMGSDITKVQAEMIKRIHPDLKIILAFDQDKTVDEIRQFSKVFDGYENLYAIVDTKGYLGDKESPVDRGYDVFKTLYNEHCYKIK